jgi:hypothetical protein
MAMKKVMMVKKSIMMEKFHDGGKALMIKKGHDNEKCHEDE